MTCSDDDLRRILRQTRVIALVGASNNPVRPSFIVGTYLAARGYRVIPVNPGTEGQMVFGEKVWPDLASIPAEIEVDMVDIFRKSEAVPALVAAALARFPRLKTIWLQFNVTHPAAAASARAQGITVIENRCTKAEHQRLSGELRKAGFNTGIITSRLGT